MFSCVCIFTLIILSILALLVYIVYYSTKNTSDDSKKETIKTLVRQASRWSIAAKQDNNPMISVLHANYGAGYLWALRDIATDDEIYNASGIDILKFRDEITRIQDDSTRNLAKVCPNYAPSDAYLTKIAGEL